MAVADSSSGETTDIPDTEPRPATAREPIRAGGLVGRYVVLERLGEGGMGVVYAAYDPQLDRKIALKLLHPAASGGDRRQRRLLREAQALARLQHPNVVAVHDVGVHDGAIFVAMELVDGRSLRAWLEETGGRRPWREVIAVFGQAAAGLAAAHEVGLVHRDFKPDNAMIDAKQRVCVMDFGLARAMLSSEGPPAIDSGVVLEPQEDASARALQRVRERLQGMGRIAAVAPRSGEGPTVPGHGVSASGPALAEPLTVRGALLGTPAYMAPEQIRGEAVDARCDQFAFCVALFEALHGKRPFAGRTLIELTSAIADGKIESTGDAGIPRRLQRLILRGLAGDPTQRHPSMTAIAAELAAVPLRRRRIAAATVTGVAAVLGAVAVARGGDAKCTGAAVSLGAAWDDARRSAVNKGLSHADAAFASVAAEQAVVTLDDYAARWIAQHEDACRATHERGEQSPALLDRRMQCLDERKQALDALGLLLADADAALAERAVEATLRLPDPDACGDREALLARAASPSDPEARARLDDARGSIARALAHEVAGRYDDGLVLARAAIETSASLQHDFVRAEAELARGRLLEGAGRADDAAAALRSAAYLGRVEGHDQVAAEAEVELVFVAGYQQSRLEEGELWAEHARAAVDRVGEAGVLRARLHNHLGVVLHRSGEVEAALERFEAALELRRRLLGDEHLDVAESHHNLGVAMRARADHDQARRHHEAALAIRRGRLGDAHPKVAESLSALAAVAMAAGDRDAAVKQWTEALAIQRAAWDDDHPKVASTLTNLGNAEAESGRLDAAEAKLRGALLILERTLASDDVQLARARYNLANVLATRGEHAGARELYREAGLAYERRLGPRHAEVAAALTELGQMHLQLGDIDDAIEVSRRAVEIVDAADLDPRTTGRACYGLATVLAKRPEHAAEARALAERARDAYRRVSAAELAAAEEFLASLP